MKAQISDLGPAVAVLRRLWNRKSPTQGILDRPLDRLLADAELVVDGRVTYAALILLGTHEALGRYLSQSEIVFEYRSSDAPGPAADRREFRQGFLPVLDPLERISLRNDLQHFQHRLFVWDVATFDERAVREAVLNAASHRDYRSSASIFVRQYPRRIEIVSPGGFHPGSRRRTSCGSRSPATAASPMCSPVAASSSGRGRASTSSTASASGTASACPTSPAPMPTGSG